MALSRKAAALSVGLFAAVTAAAFAQNPNAPRRQPKSPGETLVVAGTIDWIEKSDVSALIEGVVKQMEYQVGDRVEAGQPIGFLHDERAKLAVAKAKLAALAVGPIKKAQAQKQLAIAEKARMTRANKQFQGAHSTSELEKADAEIMVADGMETEAKENKAIAEAELAIAERTRVEHVILAPFTGYVMERLKSPGESVRANEAVIRLGRIDKLRFHGYVPLESSARIRIGDLVDVRPTVEGAELPIEKKLFRGKVKAIQRDVQTVGKVEVQVLAEIDNTGSDTDQENCLRPGLKADMTVYLSPPDVQPAGTRTASKPAR